MFAMHAFSLESLRCFVEAARLQNFRAAAKAVALSPAAFGQRIRQLEEHLEVTLFHRTTRTVVLSEQGLALVPFAERALHAIADCKKISVLPKGHIPMELVLGTRHELGLSWIVPMLRELEKKHPGLTLHLYFGSGLDLALRVRALQIDCAVTSSRITDPKLDSIRLHEERYVFVGSPRLLKRSPLQKFSDARHHVLIDTSEELPLFRYWRDAPKASDTVQFKQVLRMGTISAIHALVLEARGVAVLPEYLVENHLKTKKLVALFPHVKPRSDYFRLIFRIDDPRRSYYQTLAESMNTFPLR